MTDPRVSHEQLVAAGRARLQAANDRAARNRERASRRALTAAAARFLAPGETPAPQAPDYDRWPVTRTPREAVPAEVRSAVLAEDILCAWCRRSPSTTIDHVLPLARGGSRSVLNLVGACGPCNEAKADFLPKELGWTLRLPQRAYGLAPARGAGSGPPHTLGA